MEWWRGQWSWLGFGVGEFQGGGEKEGERGG